MRGTISIFTQQTDGEANIITTRVDVVLFQINAEDAVTSVPHLWLVLTMRVRTIIHVVSTTPFLTTRGYGRLLTCCPPLGSFL